MRMKVKSPIDDRNFSNLEILRFFAATNVVLFHLLDSANSRGAKPVLSALLGSWGASGVDLFFVISGFVIALSFVTSNPNASNFMKARFRRIVPLYWITTSVLVLVWIFVPSLLNSLTLTWPRVLESYVFSTGIFGGYPVVWVGWTLEYEVLFYLVFGCLVLIPWKWAPLIGTPLVLVTMLTFSPLQPIILEFCFGILAYLIFRLLRGLRFVGYGVLVTGVFLTGLSLIKQAEPIDRILLYGVPYTVLVLGVVLVPQMQGSLWARLGFASYSIYLTQALSLPLVMRVIPGQISSAPWADFALIVGLIVCVAFGVAVSEYVDRPLNRFLKTKGL